MLESDSELAMTRRYETTPADLRKALAKLAELPVAETRIDGAEERSVWGVPLWRVTWTTVAPVPPRRVQILVTKDFARYCAVIRQIRELRAGRGGKQKGVA